MQKISRDVSFVRDGKSLEFWLHELVSEDSDRRLAATAVIQSMQHALPSVSTDLRDLDLSHFDFKEHQRNLLHAMREAISNPDFDTPDFVRRLCALELSADAEWQRHLEANRAVRQVRDGKFDRISDALVDTINTASDEAEKQEATRRFAHLCRAYLCGGQEKREKVSPSIVAGGVARILALEALGSNIMSAPEAIESLLEVRGARYKGLRALKNAGPAAVSFAPRLLAAIDSAPKPEVRALGLSFGEDAAALGSIGRGNVQVVDALIERLSARHVLVRLSAAQALKLIAPELCGREPTIIAAILPMLDSIETSYEAVGALAAVGQDNAEIRHLIINRAKPAPARMVRPPDCPDYEYDATMTERGAAINAMQYFTSYADECLPVLIDALDTFQEFDPDEEYGGPFTRLARAIAAFGSQAGSAAVPLAKRLPNSEDELPQSILDALMAIGSAAAGALPFLESYRTKWGGPALDEENDPIGRTIQKILQGSKSQ